MTPLEERLKGYYLPKKGSFGKKLLTTALVAAGIIYYSTTGEHRQTKSQFADSSQNRQNTIETYIDKEKIDGKKDYAIVFSPRFEERILKDTTIYKIDTTIVDTTVILNDFLNNIREDYVLIVTSTEEHAPFIITKELYNKAYEVTKNASTEMEKAKLLYEWVEGLDYLPDDGRPVRNSLDTFEKSSGLCLELAYLYIAAARATGLESGLVYVDVDYEGEKVNHACAEVNIDGKRILVDPAYHQFDVKHKQFRRVKDDEAIRDYQRYRQ